MECNAVTIENVFQLVVSGDGTEIHQAIFYSAQSCLKSLEESLAEKEVDMEFSEHVRKNVQDEMGSSTELRFSLTKVDNQIKKEEKVNVPLKQFLDKNKLTGKKTLELFFQDIAENREDGFLYTNEIFNTLHSLVIESYRHRIQFTSCWDNILTEHRKVVVSRATMTGQRVSTIALILQNDETIQLVRTMLEEMDITIPPETHFFSLPKKADELRALLMKGIQTINEQHKKIEEIDKQREELRETHEQLIEVVGEGDGMACREEEQKSKSPSSGNDSRRSGTTHQVRNLEKGFFRK